MEKHDIGPRPSVADQLASDGFQEIGCFEIKGKIFNLIIDDECAPALAVFALRVGQHRGFWNSDSYRQMRGSASGKSKAREGKRFFFEKKNQKTFVLNCRDAASG